MNQNVKISARPLGAEDDVRRRKFHRAERVIIDSVTPEELIQCYRRWGRDDLLKPPEGGSPLTASGFSYSAAPGPIAGAGLPGLIAACVGFIRWRRRRKIA
jgi:hypothetical protein